MLPFGLAVASRAFTECISVVVSHLRLKGCAVYPYLDDWLFVSTTKQDLHHSVQLVTDTFNITRLVS